MTPTEWLDRFLGDHWPPRKPAPVTQTGKHAYDAQARRLYIEQIEQSRKLEAEVQASAAEADRHSRDLRDYVSRETSRLAEEYRRDGIA